MSVSPDRLTRQLTTSILGLLAAATLPAQTCNRTPNPAPGQVYWCDADGGEIKRAALDGTGEQTLVTSSRTGLLGLALDVAAGKMYWTDDSCRGPFSSPCSSPTADSGLWRANLDGSGRQRLFGGGMASGVALDLAGGKVYWSDTLAEVVRRANLDGSAMEIIASAPEAPEGVAVDPIAGKVYWTDLDKNEIRRANLDGSSPELLVSGLNEPFFIQVDRSTQKIYWTDIASHTVHRADLDGSNAEVLIAFGSGEPAGIDIDPALGHLYVTLFERDALYRANLDGTDVVELFRGQGNGGGFDLALSAPPALYGDFGDICLSTGSAQELRLDAGPAQAGASYLVLGSFSGSSPGFTFRGVTVPLNVDGYLAFTARGLPVPPISGGFGVLDAQGVGRARIAFPPGFTGLAGLTLHHAFITINARGRPQFASSAVSVALQR